MSPDQLQQELAQAAAEVRSNAHSPYSGFSVGCAVRTTSGTVHTGCNVENASFGLTVCAERNAIAAAVAAGMRPGGLNAIALIGDAPEAVTPCGACRQVITEFAAPDCRIICMNTAGDIQEFGLVDLLPHQFELPD